MVWNKKQKEIKTPFRFNAEKVFMAATQPLKSVNSYFHTSNIGLSEREVSDRLVTYGKNEISHEEKKNPFILFIKTFINPFIGVLMVLALISLVIDVILADPQEREWTGILIITTMVVISAILRFWQEWKASIATEALMRMVKNTCFVERVEENKEVDITTLVQIGRAHV